MKLIKAIIFIGVILGLMPCAGLAEFYRYKDANGVWVYTDNLMEVPDDQRPKKYEGVNDGLTEEQKARKKAEKDTKAAVRKEKRTNFPKTVSSNTDKAYADLKAEENAMEEMGKDLQAQQNALLRLRASAKTPEDKDAINLKMLDLNKKIRKYEEKRQAYIKKVETYNKMLQSKIDQ